MSRPERGGWMSARVTRDLAAAPMGERERFGKYEILRRIAVGGMAEIYLARAGGLEGFEKLVVLKRILPQYADNEEFVQMFLDEARVAATLLHSNVVQVYDIGAVDGHYFLSMEFLHGQDGRQLMKACATRHAPLPRQNALAIAIGVCAGLHYAHEKVVDGRPLDLVHRDVSPQNVFVTYDGHVKLLDFGIARASSRLAETRAGTLKGKIAYMSPEQCAGVPLDRRSDIFATSIILWEMTVGRRLFTGSSDFEILRKVKEDDAPLPSSVLPDYPPALERVVMKGLARDREQRYATAEEMLVDLEEYARDERLALSPLQLGRFMRELFKPEIEAWQAAERGGFLVDPQPQTTPSGNLLRTATSLSGPVPQLHTDPEVRPETAAANPHSLDAMANAMMADAAMAGDAMADAAMADVAMALQPKHRRGLVAAILGVIGGSLITWLLIRPPPPRTVYIEPPATTTPAAAMPEPKPRTLSAPAELPAPPEAATKAPTVARPEPAVKATAHKPLVRRAPKKPLAKKTPAKWDPESMLPP